MKKPTSYAQFKKRSYRLFPATLSGCLQSPLQEAMRKRGFTHPALLHYWPEAVGSAYAHCTQPLKLSNAVLTVKIDCEYATLFAYETEAVLKRLTTLLGYRPAQRIVLVH